MIESVGITRLDDGEPIQNSITASATATVLFVTM